MLGVYECMGKITRTFPNVRFEMCSGGGGRFDPGILFFSPQIWTSDNSDALSRTKIQYGSSFVYPICSMGAHVSAIPNRQTRRGSTMKTRALVAMSGTFGYELDPRQWTEEDVREIRAFIRMHKRVAHLVYEGDFFHLWFQAESCARMFVSPGQTRGIVMAFNLRREVGCLEPRLKLQGLRAKSTYRVEELCPGTITFDKETGAANDNPSGVYQFGNPIFLSGQTCMKAGLPVKFLFDGDSVVYEVNAVEKNTARILNGKDTNVNI